MDRVDSYGMDGIIKDIFRPISYQGVPIGQVMAQVMAPISSAVSDGATIIVLPKTVSVPLDSVGIGPVSSELTETLGITFRDGRAAIVQDLSIRHSIVTVSPVSPSALGTIIEEDRGDQTRILPVPQTFSTMAIDLNTVFCSVYEG